MSKVGWTGGPPDYRPPACRSSSNLAPMRMSIDWWAVLAAGAAIILIKTGVVAGIPW